MTRERRGGLAQGRRGLSHQAGVPCHRQARPPSRGIVRAAGVTAKPVSNSSTFYSEIPSRVSWESSLRGGNQKMKTAPPPRLPLLPALPLQVPSHPGGRRTQPVMPRACGRGRSPAAPQSRCSAVPELTAGCGCSDAQGGKDGGPQNVGCRAPSDAPRRGSVMASLKPRRAHPGPASGFPAGPAPSAVTACSTWCTLYSVRDGSRPSRAFACPRPDARDAEQVPESRLRQQHSWGPAEPDLALDPRPSPSEQCVAWAKLPSAGPPRWCVQI